MIVAAQAYATTVELLGTVRVVYGARTIGC